MRAAAALAAVLTLAVLAGGARAETFEIVPTPILVPQAAPAATADVPPAQLLGLWQQAGAAYGIPWPVLGAINKIESNFGRNMGPSSAGAIGWMQFMPATWARWGMDANGDGVADPWNPQDAVYSAARYLAAAGGQTDLPRAVFAYNHADWYVRDVLQLADLYGTGAATALSLDGLQQRLDDARAAVVSAAGDVTGAGVRVRALQARERQTPLLSDRLALEPALARQTARLAAARTALADARRTLARAQRASAAASFTPAASSLLGAPSYSSGYVFPVGGGPGEVSAAHTHHDYPAVDIAAPLGAPVYALANGVVQRAWSDPDPACGIGFTMQAADGQVWTYCHLAVLDAGVVAGAALSAGREVGLVGATGDATGPHLHLQLQPADAWPQQEAWFQSFAGTAFTWQDETPLQPVRTLAAVSAPPLPATAPVFTVVPQDASGGGVVLFSRP